MRSLQIKNFKGINMNESMWSQGFAKYAVGVDVFGWETNAGGGGVNNISLPGVIMGAPAMTVGSISAATLTDVINVFAYAPASVGANDVWGLSTGASPRLYERTALSGWGVRQTTATGLSAATGGGGLAYFNAALWVAVDNGVCEVTSPTAMTPNFGTFLSQGASPRPMKVFAGKLFIGDGSYVASIDSVPSFNQNVLALPTQFQIKSMEIYNNFLYLSCDDTQRARLYIWDGVSNLINSYFDIPEEGSAPRLVTQGGYLWLIGARNQVGTPIYSFNGYMMEKLMTLPINISTTNYFNVAPWNNGLLIVSTHLNNSSYEDGTGGIWYIGRNAMGEPFHACIAFPASGLTSTTWGGLYVGGSSPTNGPVSVFVAAKDTGSNPQVYEYIPSSSNTLNTAAYWRSLPIDAGEATRNKIWHAIKLDAQLDLSGVNSIVIKYLTDRGKTSGSPTWTTLKTFTSYNQLGTIIPIGVTSRVIQIEFDLNGGNNYQKIYGFTLLYSLTQQ